MKVPKEIKKSFKEFFKNYEGYRVFVYEPTPGNISTYDWYPEDWEEYNVAKTLEDAKQELREIKEMDTVDGSAGKYAIVKITAEIVYHEEEGNWND